jgi:hypothetical protein
VKESLEMLWVGFTMAFETDKDDFLSFDDSADNIFLILKIISLSVEDFI